MSMKSKVKVNPADFDTKLSEREEADFQAWLASMSRFMGRDLSMDLEDYDLRGQWKNGNRAMVQGQHGSDRWKKPNHPTFSSDSIYSGTTGPDGVQYVGGDWMTDAEGRDFFKPSEQMLANTHDLDNMRGYFMKYEKGIGLMHPDGAIERWE